MNFNGLDIDAQIEVSKFVEAVRIARQIGHDTVLSVPELAGMAQEIDQMYSRFTALLDVKEVPVHDAVAHVAKRLAEGDASYVDSATELQKTVHRLFGEGWDFRRGLLERSDDWEADVAQAMAWNFKPGEMIRLKDGDEVFTVLSTGFRRDGSAYHLVEEGTRLLDADDVEDARPVMQALGALVMTDEGFVLVTSNFSFVIDRLPEARFLHSTDSAGLEDVRAFFEANYPDGVMVAQFTMLQDDEGVVLVSAAGELEPTVEQADDARKIAMHFLAARSGLRPS